MSGDWQKNPAVWAISLALGSMGLPRAPHPPQANIGPVSTISAPNSIAKQEGTKSTESVNNATPIVLEPPALPQPASSEEVMLAQVQTQADHPGSAVPDDIPAGRSLDVSEAVQVADDLVSYAEEAGKANGVDPCFLLALAQQESALDPQIADGDNGQSIGLFQFWGPTIEWLRTIGIVGDPRDPPSAFRMAAQYIAYMQRTITPQELQYAAEVGIALPDRRTGKRTPLSIREAYATAWNGGVHFFANRRTIAKLAAVEYGRDVDLRTRLCSQGDVRWRLKQIWRENQ